MRGIGADIPGVRWLLFRPARCGQRHGKRCAQAVAEHGAAARTRAFVVETGPAVLNRGASVAGIWPVPGVCFPLTACACMCVCACLARTCRTVLVLVPWQALKRSAACQAPSPRRSPPGTLVLSLSSVAGRERETAACVQDILLSVPAGASSALQDGAHARSLRH